MVSFFGFLFSLQELESSSMASIVAPSSSTAPFVQDPTLVKDVSKSLFLHYGENPGAMLVSQRPTTLSEVSQHNGILNGIFSTKWHP